MGNTTTVSVKDAFIAQLVARGMADGGARQSTMRHLYNKPDALFADTIFRAFSVTDAPQPTSTISASNVLNSVLNAASVYCNIRSTRLRLIEEGNHTSALRGRDFGIGAAYTTVVIDETVWAHLSDNSIGGPTVTPTANDTALEPTAGQTVSYNDFVAFLSDIVSRTQAIQDTAIAVDQYYCHTSCHNSCHTSRERR